MEGPNLMENGNNPQERRFTCHQLAFYASVFALIIALALVPIVFCLLHHEQASESCWAHGECKYGDSRPAFWLCQACAVTKMTHACSKKRLNTPSTENPDIMRWKWELEHCNGFVRKDRDQFLIIEHSGKYFIYAQIHRLKEMETPFTLTLYKEPNMLLNKAGGPMKGDVMATVNFARPFFLKKGDRLYCKENEHFGKIPLGNQSYWGLFKM